MHYSFAGFFKINENDIDMYKKLFNEYYNIEESKLKTIELLDVSELKMYFMAFEGKEQLKLIIRKFNHCRFSELELNHIIKYLNFDERLELNNIYLLTNEEIENNWSIISLDIKIQYFNLNDYDINLCEEFIKNLSYEDKERFITSSCCFDNNLLNILLNSNLDDHLKELLITKICDVDYIDLIWKYLNDNQKLKLCKYHFVK